MTFMPTSSPFDLFDHWLADAKQTEPVDHNAMALATVNADGQPAVRIVLLKGHDSNGFRFFTNHTSRKGKDLTVNQAVALNFYWKSRGRQIRIEGRAAHLTATDSDAYFASRPRGSQIGAWASQQSSPLPGGRSDLLAAVAQTEQTYSNQPVPRPPHWGGYRVVPHRIEFWQDGDFRLHDRAVYVRRDHTPDSMPDPATGWTWQWLYP